MPVSFWESLTDQERVAISKVSRPRSYAPRSPLLYEGDASDHVTVIAEGWTKAVSTTQDGHEVLLALRGPGDLVGESAVLGDRQRSATVVALGPVQALVVSAARFMAFLEAHPRVWRVVTRTYVHRLDQAERRINWNASAGGEQRLALLLIELAELSARYTAHDPGGSIAILPPLSQEELGAWVDLSRESVARTLKTMRRSNLIRTGWRKIIVVDLDGLRSYAHRPTHNTEPPSPVADIPT